MTETAALKLRRAIMRGELSPGTRLVPAKLEQTLGLSRISIREAIRELVGSGLVESATHKGAYIAEPLDFDEIRDIFELRYQIEGKAAYLGTHHISEADIIRMEFIQEKLIQITSISEGFFLNQEFHMILYRASGWRYLIKTIERLFDQVLAFRSYLSKQASGNLEGVLSLDKYTSEIVAEHNQILQSVRERKADDVREQIVRHIQRQGFDAIYETYKRVVKNENRL